MLQVNVRCNWDLSFNVYIGCYWWGKIRKIHGEGRNYKTYQTHIQQDVLSFQSRIFKSGPWFLASFVAARQEILQIVGLPI